MKYKKEYENKEKMMLDKGVMKMEMECMHEKAPYKVKLQQDMPVGGDQSAKLKMKKMSDKGHVPMARQDMMMDY